MRRVARPLGPEPLERRQAAAFKRGRRAEPTVVAEANRDLWLGLTQRAVACAKQQQRHEDRGKSPPMPCRLRMRVHCLAPHLTIGTAAAELNVLRGPGRPCTAE